MSRQCVILDDVELVCNVYGEGRTIVLVHGFPLDSSMWSEQIAALSRQFRVIAPNLRGFGGSTLAAADVDNGVAMQRYAEDLCGLFDAFAVREPALLVGFSMGGYAALQFALLYPQLLGGLALCDTRSVADATPAREARLNMADAVLEAGNSDHALAMVEKLLAAQTVSQRPDVVQRLREMILAASPEAIAAAQRGMACREDVSDQLGSIGIPTLVLAGAEDQISTPAEMQEIAAKLSDARYIEVENAGHMTTIENAEAVAEALDKFAREIF